MNFKKLGLLISFSLFASLNAMRTEETKFSKTLIEQQSQDFLEEFGNLPSNLQNAFLHECFDQRPLSHKKAQEIAAIAPTLLIIENGKYEGIPLSTHILTKALFKLNKQTNRFDFNPRFTSKRKK